MSGGSGRRDEAESALVAGSEEVGEQCDVFEVQADSTSVPCRWVGILDTCSRSRLAAIGRLRY